MIATCNRSGTLAVTRCVSVRVLLRNQAIGKCVSVCSCSTWSLGCFATLPFLKVEARLNRRCSLQRFRSGIDLSSGNSHSLFQVLFTNGSIALVYSHLSRPVRHALTFLSSRLGVFPIRDTLQLYLSRLQVHEINDQKSIKRIETNQYTDCEEIVRYFKSWVSTRKDKGILAKRYDRNGVNNVGN